MIRMEHSMLTCLSKTKAADIVTLVEVGIVDSQRLSARFNVECHAPLVGHMHAALEFTVRVLDTRELSSLDTWIVQMFSLNVPGSLVLRGTFSG